jgi:hypothetical protein
MQPFSPGRGIVCRQRLCTIGITGHLVEITMQETYALTIEEIDCRYQNHCISIKFANSLAPLFAERSG